MFFNNLRAATIVRIKIFLLRCCLTAIDEISETLNKINYKRNTWRTVPCGSIAATYGLYIFRQRYIYTSMQLLSMPQLANVRTVHMC